MFVKRNVSTVGSKQYRSVLLVHGERVPAEGPKRGRPRKDAPRKTKVVHRTLANLSKLPDDLVELIERWCRQETPVVAAGAAPGIRMGPCYGVLGALHALGAEIGLIRALGPGRMAKLALFLVYAEVNVAVVRGSVAFLPGRPRLRAVSV